MEIKFQNGVYKLKSPLGLPSSASELREGVAFFILQPGFLQGCRFFALSPLLLTAMSLGIWLSEQKLPSFSPPPLECLSIHPGNLEFVSAKMILRSTMWSFSS